MHNLLYFIFLVIIKNESEFFQGKTIRIRRKIIENLKVENNLFKISHKWLDKIFMSCKQEPAPNTKFLLSTGPKTKLLALNSKEYQTNKDKTLALCDNTTSSVFVFFDRDDETEDNQNNNDNDISTNIMD